MLLRNYDNLVSRILLNFTGTDSFEEGHLGIIDFKGQSSEVTLGDSTRLPFQIFQQQENNNVSCGTTNISYVKWSDSVEEVSYDEYSVSLPNTSQAVSVDTVNTYDEESNMWIKTVTAIYRAKQDLTVGSIAVFCSQRYYQPNVECMVYRKVLDNPIEVTTNSNFILKFTVFIQNPSSQKF